MDCVVGVVAAVKRGGGGKLARVSFLRRDSASGSHCTDFTNFLKKHRLAASGIPCFERTADLKSSSLSKPATAVQGEAEAGFFRKFVKNSTSNTAIPRILEEEKQASLRDFALAKSWQSIPHKPSPHTLESKRHKLHASTYSLHTILESIFDKTQMDCHAIATALARNDRKNAASKKVDSRSEAQNLKTPTKDSRIFDKTAQNVFSQNATRRQDFGDKNGALQGDSRAHTRAYVSAESPQQSPFLAQKPTPKRLAL